MRGLEDQIRYASYLDNGRVEPEPSPKDVAFLFPGQGLEPKDIVTFYNFLMSLHPDVTEDYLRQAQEAVDRFQPGKFSIAATLSKKDAATNPSPLFQSTDFVQPIVYTLSKVDPFVNTVKR